MKFAKNFMMYAVAAVVAMAMTACGTPTPDEPTPGGNTGNVTFTVEAVAGETTATINVSHTGTAENTWYGFLTTESKTNDLDLIFAVTTAGVKAEKLSTGTTATINLTDLELATEYKYVVFGLNADGSMYGTSGSAVFTTEDGRSVAENSAWTVEYIGNYTDEESGKTYINCVNVTSTDDNTYYVDYFTPEQWDVVKTDMYGYVESLIAQMKAVLQQYNAAYGTTYTFEDLFLSSGGIASLGELDPGQYIAVVWGITADEKVSRLYAKSAEFEVVEEDATPEYSAWIGNWTAAGEGSTYIPAENPEAKGTYEEGPISFDFTLEKNINNKSYVMDGWTGITDVPFLVKYDAENDMLVITTDAIAEGVDFGDYGTGTIYLLAEVLVGGEPTMYYGLDVLMGTTSAGEKIIVGGDYSSYGLELYSMGLYFSLDADTGTEYEGYVYAMSDITPYFPLTLTPAVAAPAEVSAKASAMDRSIINRAEGKYLKTWNNYEVGKSKFNSIKF